MEINSLVLMLGSKIVAIFDGKENKFFHTSEHDLADKKFRYYSEHILADDPTGLKRSDVFHYWKTTKRGRVYRPTSQRIGNITSLIA